MTHLTTLDAYLNHYGEYLKSKGRLSSTWLMYEVMNEISDDELKTWNRDIVDVAEEVLDYIERTGVYASQTKRKKSDF